MPETKKAWNKILGHGDTEASEQSFTKERQHTAQAFNLHVERKDGRHTEGFGWSHYVGYDWKDEGEQERLVVIFGSRAVEIHGHNLGALVTEIREGQLNGIKELVSREATLFEHEGAEGPIIASVKSYPDVEQILSEIKGEDDDKHRHAKRVAGR